ncbi:MAG: DUF192 domain-containing protein [Gammaproteobacteria bacterium]|nr:DUF192 domain-containing protein [Gammaproteobacteria bacterium]
MLLGSCLQHDYLEIRVDDAVARVEVADSRASRQQGLMHRKSLDRDTGMLMVFPEEKVLQIWMLNTLIPLDVGFFDKDGRLLNVASMEPDGGRRIYESRGAALYALEMNPGWFERHKLRPGARLHLPRSVLTER